MERSFSGDYRPLVPTLKALNVGNYLLELCTPRAGEMEALKDLPQDRRVGIGLVNPKTEIVESLEEIIAKAKKAADLFGADRIFLTPTAALQHLRTIRFALLGSLRPNSVR